MWIVGIDLGGTNLKAALLDERCRIRHRQTLSTARFPGQQGLIDAIVELVHSLCRAHHIPLKQVKGVGIGVPGPVDTAKGVVHFFPNIPGWKNVTLRDILSKKLGADVFLDNDANVMALAEFKQGAAAGSRNAVCLTLGTGVGGGMIIEGRLYRGSTFAAGEIGHMPLNENGPDCGCGGSGCLETYVGNKRILARAAKLFKRQISLEELSGLAHKGNRKALRVWEEVGEKLGVVLAGVINLINPDCIVIGGGVANAGSVLFGPVRETVLLRAMLPQAKKVKIVKAKLGSDAGLIGAGLLVIHS